MTPRDLSRACWRCTWWAGFAGAAFNHSSCARLNASPLQASPATGCASWQPGAGNSLPADWLPVGFKPWEGPRIYGRPSDPDVPPPRPRHERPGMPGEQFAFDQGSESAAWRLTGEFLNRARRG